MCDSLAYFFLHVSWESNYGECKNNLLTSQVVVLNYLGFILALQLVLTNSSDWLSSGFIQIMANTYTNRVNIKNKFYYFNLTFPFLHLRLSKVMRKKTKTDYSCQTMISCISCIKIPL